MHMIAIVVAAFNCPGTGQARSALPAGTRPVAFKDLDHGYPGSTIALSLDGKLIAAEQKHDLIVLSRTGRVISRLGDGIMPRWSPSGRRLAFYSTRSGNLQLWVWDLQSRVLSQVTRLDGGISPDPGTAIFDYLISAFDYDWSPDEQNIVFGSRVAAPQVKLENDPQIRPEDSPLILDNRTPQYLTLQGVLNTQDQSEGAIQDVPDGRDLKHRPRKPNEFLVNQLFLVEIANGRTKQITHGLRSYFSPVFTSPTTVASSSLSLSHGIDSVRQALQTILPSPEIDLMAVDLSNLKAQVLISGIGITRHLRYCPRSDRIVFLKSRSINDQPSIGSFELARRKILEYRFAGPVRDFSCGPANSLSVAFEEHDLPKFGVLSPEDPKPRNSVPVTQGSRTWSYMWPTGEDGSRVWIEDGYVMRLSGGSRNPQRLFDFDAERRSLSLGKSETVTWVNSRGEKLFGRVLLPPNYIRGKKYPTIVDAYPLSNSDYWWYPTLGNYGWAALGYVVFKAAPRSPHTWMNAADASFRRAAKGSAGWDVGIDDLLSGVNSLIDRGITDKDRMCVYGQSNGGGFVSYLITKTDVFKCAVIISPAAADWIRPALLETNGRDIQKTLSGGIDFDENPVEFLKMSSVFFLKRAKTPTLIAAGDNDGRFLLDAIEVYNGLRAANVEVTFLRYPGQEHIFDLKAMSDLWGRTILFFNRFLKDHPKGAHRLERQPN
jgi:dipeptidyl aminopeptidase/acylaminoacyl peptidase